MVSVEQPTVFYLHILASHWNAGRQDCEELTDRREGKFRANLPGGHDPQSRSDSEGREKLPTGGKVISREPDSRANETVDVKEIQLNAPFHFSLSAYVFNNTAKANASKINLCKKAPSE